MKINSVCVYNNASSLPPGIGKTTLVKKVCSELQSRHEELAVRGFSVEEVRERYTWVGRECTGPKIGYDIITMNGARGTLARVDVYVIDYHYQTS